MGCASHTARATADRSLDINTPHIALITTPDIPERFFADARQALDDRTPGAAYTGVDQPKIAR